MVVAAALGVGAVMEAVEVTVLAALVVWVAVLELGAVVVADLEDQGALVAMGS
jgi:hypothetical protein